MQRIENVQALRGVAALMVLAIHAIAAPTLYGPNVILPWAEPFLGRYGPAGVDIFFVISGFIIMTVAHQAGLAADMNNRFTIAREFAIKRCVRIYPVYWCVFLFAAVVSSVVVVSAPLYGSVPKFYLFFLLSPNNKIVNAAWSLSYELYFYLIVTIGLIIVPKKIFKFVFSWFIVSIIFISIFRVNSLNNEFTTILPFHPIIIEFVFGAIIAYLISVGIRNFALSSLICGLMLFLAGAEINRQYFGWEQFYRVFCFGIPSMLLLYGLIALELQHRLKFPAQFSMIGDASYSIYIWHQPIIYSLITLAVYLKLMSYVPAALLVAAWSLTAIAVGFASYKFLEMPINRFGRVLASLGTGNSGLLGSKRLTLIPNLLFFGAIVLLPSLAVIGTFKFKKAPTASVPSASFAENGASGENSGPNGLAEWPLRAGLGKLVFTGEDNLDKSASIELPASAGASKIDLRIQSSGAGAVYVGYRQNGGTVEKWYNFGAGRSLVSFKIDKKVDDGLVWIVRDTKQSLTRLESVIVSSEGFR